MTSAPDPHEDLPCPIPGCDAGLILDVSEGHYLTQGMFTGEAELRLHRPFCTSWEVRCLHGHVLLMPEDQNGVETFGEADYERLRALTELRPVTPSNGWAAVDPLGTEYERAMQRDGLELGETL